MTRRNRAHSETGSATALVAGACALVLLFGIGVVVAAGAAQAAAQARAAADLSAVAAARTLIDGLAGRDRARPCATAADVATRNGADLHACVIDDQVNVTVRVAVPFRSGIGWLPDRLHAEAAARAGPAP